jgi:hypothetical protein
MTTIEYLINYAGVSVGIILILMVLIGTMKKGFLFQVDKQ